MAIKKEKAEKKDAKIKKQQKGIVVKVLDENTIKVEVETKAQHPIYKKITKSHKRYAVDASNVKSEVKTGEQVVIEECAPVSKTKFFKLVK